MGMLVLLSLPASLPALRDACDQARVLARRITVERQQLAAAFPHGHAPTRIVFSDTPDYVAWITGLPTLWVTRAQFERLYPPGGGAGDAPRFDLPPRNVVAGWFHDDFRDPENVGTLFIPR
jgi:hypothetical protein